MDDLISRFRDYQIEWLTSHNDIEFCEEEEKLIIGFLKDTAESFMRENQSAQQWIPVEEETPILPNIVLVCDSLGKILFDSYIDGSWTYCPYVVAWMPLPEPYRGESDV